MSVFDVLLLWNLRKEIKLKILILESIIFILDLKRQQPNLSVFLHNHELIGLTAQWKEADYFFLALQHVGWKLLQDLRIKVKCSYLNFLQPIVKDDQDMRFGIGSKHSRFLLFFVLWRSALLRTPETRKRFMSFEFQFLFLKGVYRLLLKQVAVYEESLDFARVFLLVAISLKS